MKISNLLKRYITKRDSEYSKRLLTKIVNHSIIMMYCTYILAWFDKVEIAEALSKTLATSIIAVVVGYLAKSVIENVNKYGKGSSVSAQKIPEDDLHRDC